MKTLVFATNNPNKVKEVAYLLGGEFEVKSLRDIGCLEDIPETGSSLEENAIIKAQHVWKNYGLDCFADDTGLEVEALNGEPGIYSARYAGEQCSSKDNMQLLLEKLEGYDNRKARFRTVISLVQNGFETHFEGIAKGEIRQTLAGAKGFGYDPIFEPEGQNTTFAEMSMDEKNQISHRGQAIRKFVDYLKNKDVVTAE